MWYSELTFSRLNNLQSFLVTSCEPENIQKFVPITIATNDTKEEFVSFIKSAENHNFNYTVSNQKKSTVQAWLVPADTIILREISAGTIQAFTK